MNMRSMGNIIKDSMTKVVFHAIGVTIIFDFFVILWIVSVGPFQYEHIRFSGTSLRTDSLWRPLVILFALLGIRWFISRRVKDNIKLGPFENPGYYFSLSLLIYLGIILPVLLYKYYSFEWKFPHDLAVLNQVFYNTLHGFPFYDTIFLYHKLEIFNYLGDHFEPIICLLLPFYYFNQDTSCLIIMQSLAITLSAIPVYFIAKDKLKNYWIALFISILYITNPLVISLHFLAFRPITIAIPFLLFSFYFIQVGRIWTSIIFLLFAALCQESVFVATFGIGVFLLFRKKIKGHLKFGFVVIFLSICGLYFIVFKLIPHFSGCGFIPFSQFGGGEWLTLNKAFGNIMWRLMTYSDAETNRYLVGIIKNLGFIPILSPVILISLPFFLQAYLSGIGDQFWHASLIVPFLFISLIYGINNLTRISRKMLIPSMLILTVFGVHCGVRNFQDKMLSSFFRDKLYFSFKPENYKYFAEAKKLIPRDSSLLTNVTLLPNLSARKEIHSLFSLGREESIDIDWILYYESFAREIAHQPFLEGKFNSLISDNKFLTIYNNSDFYVMGKVKGENLGMEWNFREPGNFNLWIFNSSNVVFDYNLGKEGLVVNTHFDGPSTEDEFVQMRYDEVNLNLKKYPFLNLEYVVENSDIQTIEIVVGIDFNNDREDDHIVRGIITSEKEGVFTVSLLNDLKGEFINSLYYNLVFIELYLHKRWYINCSKIPKKGNYNFRINRLWLSD